MSEFDEFVSSRTVAACASMQLCKQVKIPPFNSAFWNLFKEIILVNILQCYYPYIVAQQRLVLLPLYTSGEMNERKHPCNADQQIYFVFMRSPTNIFIVLLSLQRTPWEYFSLNITWKWIFFHFSYNMTYDAFSVQVHLNAVFTHIKPRSTSC
jgi:hypothetical protein